MPTGYTLSINNDISFEEFVLDCAKAFWGDISGPLPHEVKPSPYYSNKIEEIKQKIQKIKSASLKECEKLAKAEHQETLKYYSSFQTDADKLKIKYNKMLEKVKNWSVPKQLLPLKNFMIEQITTSIQHDCEGCSNLFKTDPPLSGKEWRDTQLINLQEELKRAKEHWVEEVEKTEHSNTWLKLLRASL